MAAAVLSPGGVFMDKPKKKKVVDINHFHVTLAHAHWSVLKANVLQHGIQLVGELAPCSGCSIAKGIRAPTPHHTVPGSGSHGHGAHRHRGTILGVTRRLAMCRHVRGQRFLLPAPVRGPGQERICHPRWGKTSRGRHGSSTGVQDRQRRRVHQLDIH